MWSLRLEAWAERREWGNNTRTVHTARWWHIDYLCAGLRSKLQNHKQVMRYRQRERWGKDLMLLAGLLRGDCYFFFFFFLIGIAVLKQNPVGNGCDRREGNCAVPLVQLGHLVFTGLMKCCGVSKNSHQTWQLKDMRVFVHMCNSAGSGGVTGRPGFGEEQLPHGAK